MDRSHPLLFLLPSAPYTRRSAPALSRQHASKDREGVVGISGAPTHQDKALAGLPSISVPPTALPHQQSYHLQAGGGGRSSETPCPT